jgi:hypothetical protein
MSTTIKRRRRKPAATQGRDKGTVRERAAQRSRWGGENPL